MNITYRQFSLLFLVSVGAVSVFYSPVSISSCVGSVGWAVPLILLVPFLLFFLMYWDSFRRTGSVGFGSLLASAFGDKCSSVVRVFYSFYFLFLTALKLSVFASRLVDNAFFYFPPLVCIGGLLLCVSVALFSGIKAFGRTAQVLFLVFVITLVVVVILSAKSVDIRNFQSITVYELPLALRVSLYPLSVLSYYTYFSFIPVTGSVLKSRKWVAILTAASVGCALTVFTLDMGVFGEGAVSKFVFPFFSLLKSTTTFGSLEHLEAIVIALWCITDFCLVSGLLFATTHNLHAVVKNESSRRWLVVVLPFLVFAICVAFQFSSATLVNRLNTGVVPVVNLFFGVVLPVIAWLVTVLKQSFRNKNSTNS